MKTIYEVGESNREKISGELLTSGAPMLRIGNSGGLSKKGGVAGASRRQYGLLINKKRKTSGEMGKETTRGNYRWIIDKKECRFFASEIVAAYQKKRVAVASRRQYDLVIINKKGKTTASMQQR